MLRVKDNEKSLKFYKDVLGMSLIRTLENESAGFNLYFLAYTKHQPETAADAFPAQYEGILELTWNYGTEKDENFKYHNGNDEPQGFGHICKYPSVSTMNVGFTNASNSPGISVDNIEAACQRFEEHQTNWKKRLTDGRMKNVAFLLDPDNYWVEIVQNERFTGKANF